MSLIDNDKHIISINSIAELLNAKPRTLKVYEEKGLLPERGANKLYTLNDVKKIAFIHYLAGINKINANGIKFINQLMSNYMESQEVEKILKDIEEEFIKTPDEEIYEVDSL